MAWLDGELRCNLRWDVCKKTTKTCQKEREKQRGKEKKGTLWLRPSNLHKNTNPKSLDKIQRWIHVRGFN